MLFVCQLFCCMSLYIMRFQAVCKCLQVPSVIAIMSCQYMYMSHFSDVCSLHRDVHIIYLFLFKIHAQEQRGCNSCSITRKSIAWRIRSYKSSHPGTNCPLRYSPTVTYKIRLYAGSSTTIVVAHTKKRNH